MWTLFLNDEAYSTHTSENEAWSFCLRYDLDMEGKVKVELVDEE